MKANIICTLLLLSLGIATADESESFVQKRPCSEAGWICWLGDGDDFQKMNWSEDIDFDPKTAMPELSDADKEHPLSWMETPKNLNIFQNILLIVGTHHVQQIVYFTHDPSNRVQQQAVIVLCWDNRPFCISFGEAGVSSPETSTDSTVIDSKRGSEIDVGLYMSGTGAFNAHALFEFTSGKPRLLRISHGGRSR